MPSVLSFKRVFKSLTMMLKMGYVEPFTADIAFRARIVFVRPDLFDPVLVHHDFQPTAL
jgi:hypothetical protein